MAIIAHDEDGALDTGLGDPHENDERPKCSFGDGDLAVVTVYLSEGCVARRGDREQHLCAQHLASMDPMDDVQVTRRWSDTAWMDGSHNTMPLLWEE